MSQIDWTSYCQPMQDQGNCGSCTGFGCTGATEGRFKLLLGINVKMSEKDAFFCSGGFCQIGNTVEAVLDRLKRGVSSEECSPYVDYDVYCGFGRCANWWETGYKIESWKSITKIEEMKHALQDGPLVGVMQVHQSFMNYISGVYHSLGTSDPVLGGHCITIVGYDDKKNAWKLRNSWGTGWGMQGYCWIKYGDSVIDEEMWQVIPSPDKPDPDSPSPCQFGNNLTRLGNFFAKILHRKGRFYYRNP